MHLPHRYAFNRTSMESKLSHSVIAAPQQKSFNRTSMESKLWNFIDRSLKTQLLIEPVWNRNLDSDSHLHDDRLLLIEPVWNRNGKGGIEICLPHKLLIEPVWNRNSFLRYWLLFCSIHF